VSFFRKPSTRFRHSEKAFLPPHLRSFLNRTCCRVFSCGTDRYIGLPLPSGRHTAIPQNSQNICGTDSPHRWRRVCLLIDDQLAGMPQHSPCCLVGDAGFALNSFRGNPALCRGHSVDHVKPSLQRSRASRKHSPLQRVDVISAIIAGVGCATGHARVLALHIALLAPGDTVRPARLFYVFQAGILIWKFAFKLGYRIPQVLRIGLPVRILQVTLGG